MCRLLLFAQVKPLEWAVRKQHGHAGSMLHVSLMQGFPAEPVIIVPQRRDRKNLLHKKTLLTSLSSSIPAGSGFVDSIDSRSNWSGSADSFR